VSLKCIILHTITKSIRNKDILDTAKVLSHGYIYIVIITFQGFQLYIDVKIMQLLYTIGRYVIHIGTDSKI